MANSYISSPFFMLTKLRVHFERMVKELPAGSATIIRINPAPVDSEPSLSTSVITITEPTSTALHKIDRALLALPVS